LFVLSDDGAFSHVSSYRPSKKVRILVRPHRIRTRETQCFDYPSENSIDDATARRDGMFCDWGLAG
jgi:hypothetical protein